MSISLLVKAYRPEYGHAVCEVIPGSQVGPHLREDGLVIVVLDQVVLQSHLVVEPGVDDCLVRYFGWTVLKRLVVDRVVVPRLFLLEKPLLHPI